jgi:hypothetical protein
MNELAAIEVLYVEAVARVGLYWIAMNRTVT